MRPQSKTTTTDVTAFLRQAKKKMRQISETTKSNKTDFLDKQNR